MSIINDALKKAGKDKQPFANQPAKKTKWMLWMGTLAVSILAVVVVNNSLKSSFDAVSVQETTPETGVPSIVEIAPSVFQMREVDIEPAGNFSDFRLKGILYDQQKPLALVNNRVVSEGTHIDGAKVLEIQSNSVKFSLKGKEFTLEIK